MSGKITLHGLKQVVIPSTVTISLDSTPVGKVCKNETIEIPITKNCLLSVNIGTNHSEAVSIRNGTLTEYQIKHNPYENLSLIQLRHEILEPNAPASDNFDQDSNESPVYILDGGTGDNLVVYEDRVIIRHKGVLNVFAMGVNGDKTLYYSDITSVQYKKAGFISGHIQFSIPGGNESKGGVLNAASDENTITLSKNTSSNLADEVVEYINKKIREYKTKKNISTTVIQQTTAADELKKFKELLDMGIITQEEFDAKKKQLLGI